MYLVQTFEKPGMLERRAELRNEHLRYLDATKQVLAAAGATLDDETGQPNGSLYILDVDSREAVDAYFADEPFAKAGLIESIRVELWRKAFLDGHAYVEIAPE